jgi:hypothetical protein
MRSIGEVLVNVRSDALESGFPVIGCQYPMYSTSVMRLTQDPLELPPKHGFVRR